MAGKYLLPVIQKSVRNTSMLEIGQQAQVVLSAFGADAGLTGAVALVVEAILTSPTTVTRI